MTEPHAGTLHRSADQMTVPGSQACDYTAWHSSWDFAVPAVSHTVFCCHKDIRRGTQPVHTNAFGIPALPVHPGCSFVMVSQFPPNRITVDISAEVHRCVPHQTAPSPTRISAVPQTSGIYIPPNTDPRFFFIPGGARPDNAGLHLTPIKSSSPWILASQSRIHAIASGSRNSSASNRQKYSPSGHI